MPVELRLQIVFAMALVLLLLVAYMILIRTIGALSHSVDRVEQVLEQELLLSVEKIALEKKIEIQAKLMDKDRNRRNELLLNIPVMRDVKKPGGQS